MSALEEVNWRNELELNYIEKVINKMTNNQKKDYDLRNRMMTSTSSRTVPLGNLGNCSILT